MKMKLCVLLVALAFTSDKNEIVHADFVERIEKTNAENSVVVKIEEDEYVKENKRSQYIGVRCKKNRSRWQASRWSKNEKRNVCHGSYDNEETTAHASDTLARKLMKNGEHGHKLNFPDDETEVHPDEKKVSSNYIGVCYIKSKSRWQTQRLSKNEGKRLFNGYYDNEETAAHASDTLARSLIKNGEHGHKLNFPDDDTEVRTEKKRYIGVYCNKINSKWQAQRWSKYENKMLSNGYYDNEETAAHASDTLARSLIKNGEHSHKLNFPDNETEVHPEKKRGSSNYIGLTYNKSRSKWYAQRWSKSVNKLMCNGSYENEETAAHASDTLAKKLIKIGDQDHQLNFPDDETEVHPDRTSSNYIGVTYHKNNSKWYAGRWSKNENKLIYNGCYDNEETAAHVSDTLARNFMKNGEHGHKLNFPDDDTEVNQNKKKPSSHYIGVTYNKISSKWCTQRRDKYENKLLFNGCYDNEKTAAHASDTLARRLMKNGKHCHKLNFPDDETEIHPKKRSSSNYIGVTYNKNILKWCAQRWNKNQNKLISNGCYDNEATAARASDTLAKKLMKNGEQVHKLNFPDDDSGENSNEQHKKKRKRLEDYQDN